MGYKMSNYKEIAKSYLSMIEEKAKYPHMMYHPESGEEVEVKTPEEHDKYAEKGYTHEKPDLEEAKEHPAYKELMSLAKELDGRDTRAIQVIAGKISNFTATGNRSNIVDLAKAFKALDSYPRDGVIEILQKHDKSLLKSILAKAGMNESTKAYAASLEKMANDKKLKSISKADRETLAKLADLMKNANEAVVEEEITNEDLEEMDLSKVDTKKLLQFNRKYADRKMGPSDANQVRAVRRELIKRGVSVKEEVELDEGAFKGVGKYLAKRKFAKKSKQAYKDAQKSISKAHKYNFDDVKNREPHEKDFMDKMKKSDRYNRAANRLNREEVEIDEAKGTGVKKFVKGMRVAKIHNPDMKGTVIKGGDNMKKGVEVEWDSGTTTVASGKYLMSIKKNESVEITTEDKERYQKFFNAALKKFGIKSPADLSGDKKKEFFDYVDKNYKADNESD